MRRFAFVLLVLAVGCGKKDAPPAQSTTQPAAAASQSAPAASSAAPAAPAPAGVPPSSDADDLAGLAQGAVIAVAAESLESNHGAFRLIDEDPRTTWVSAQDKPTGPPTATVIELPQRASIDRVQFDTEESGLDTHVPKDVTVEMSDTSATTGFKTIAKGTLVQKNGQTLPADASAPGRFIRVTVASNHGGGITEIGEFHAFGKRLADAPAPNVTGAYETSHWGTLNLSQSGSTVTGCYEGALTPLVGGVEGRAVKFTLDRAEDKGPVILVASLDGKTVFGGFWKTDGVVEHPEMSRVDLNKTSDKPAACPGAKTPEDDMAKALADEKRLRLYGINFDSDSDRLRDQSKPTLDLVAAMLKHHADWKVTIEGHTDSTSTPEHNQQLSTARANAVKTYLTNAGIDAARLTPAGFGATKPIASNDTALGRAANRRVELAR